MKDFERKNLMFSLCGLNCVLCPMKLGEYCPGCGGGPGNQSCSFARCSLSHDNVEYCTPCPEFACEKYDDIEHYDSFHTFSVKEKAERIGSVFKNLAQQKNIVLKLRRKKKNEVANDYTKHCDGTIDSYSCDTTNYNITSKQRLN